MLGGELHRGERPTRRTDLVPPIREQRGEWPSVCASVLRAEGILVPLDVDGRPLLGVADVLQPEPELIRPEIRQLVVRLLVSEDCPGDARPLASRVRPVLDA